MAKLKGIAVTVQAKVEDGTWRDLREMEVSESIKEQANSAARWTTGLEAVSGRFRFAISVSSEEFDWANSNGLHIALTLDEGYSVRECPVLVLKPGVTANKLADQLKVGIMTYCPFEDQLQYTLDSISTSVDHCAGDKFYRAEFAFKRLKVDHSTDTSSSFVFRSELARLQVDIIPCLIYASTNPRLIRLKPASNIDNAKEKSRRAAAAAGLTLQTQLDIHTYEPRDNTFSYSFKRDVKQKYTFVFLYREAGSGEELKDVDVIKLSTAKEKPRSSSRSSSILPTGTPDREIASTPNAQSKRPKLKPKCSRTSPPLATPSAHAKRSGVAAATSTSTPNPYYVQKKLPQSPNRGKSVSDVTRSSSVSRAESPIPTNNAQSPHLRDSINEYGSFEQPLQNEQTQSDDNTRILDWLSASSLGKEVLQTLQKGESDREQAQQMQMKHKLSLQKIRHVYSQKLEKVTQNKMKVQSKLDELTRELSTLDLEETKLKEKDAAVKVELDEIEATTQSADMPSCQEKTLRERLEVAAGEYAQFYQNQLAETTTRKRRWSEISSVSSPSHKTSGN